MAYSTQTRVCVCLFSGGGFINHRQESFQVLTTQVVCVRACVCGLLKRGRFLRGTFWSPGSEEGGEEDKTTEEQKKEEKKMYTYKNKGKGGGGICSTVTECSIVDNGVSKTWLRRLKGQQDCY